MERLARSFRLVSQSFRILMTDAELMVLPLISGIVMALVVASFVFGVGVDALEADAPGAGVYIPGFVTYVVLYAVAIFFQCAVVAGATERMRGEAPTLRSSMGAAWRRAGSILLWAMFAGTIGLLLRAIQERSGIIGRIVVGLIGAGWSLATFFVVPVLVLEEVQVGDVVGRSLSVLRRTWGEAIVGGASIGLVAFCAWGTLIMVTLGLASIVGNAALLFLFVFGIALAILFSALEGVYVASLYRYAIEGDVPPGFDKDTLADAFVPKRR